MKIKRVLKLAAAIIAAASITASCGAAPAENVKKEYTPLSPEEFQEAMSSPKRGKFTVFHFHAPGAGGVPKAFWNAADKYTGENPDVAIRYNFTDSSSYEEKLTIMMAGNELPDVWVTKADMLRTFADAGMIRPAETFLAADPEWADSYLEDAFGECTYRDMRWGLPYQMQSNCVAVYNEAVFKECGIEKWPETWQEMAEDCEKIRAKGYIPIAMGNRDQWPGGSVLFNTYLYKYVGKEWAESLMAGEGAAFTDEAVVRCLKDYQGLMQYFNEDLNSQTQDEMYSMYYNGRAAMFFTGAWGIGTVIEQCPKEILKDTHLGFMPAVEGEAGSVYDTAAGAGWYYVINSSLEGEDLYAAIAFVKAVTSGDYAEDALMQGFLPAIDLDTHDERLVGGFHPLFREYLSMAEKMESCPVLDCVLPPEVGAGVMCADIQKLMSNMMTPEELAEDLQTVMESYY